MVAVVERDRRLALRLVAALEARGCRVRVAHGYKRARALLRSERPHAVYVSEALQRASGGDLLAEIERDDTLAELPALVRISRFDSVFARALRRGGLSTVQTAVDVEAAAELLARMERAEEGQLQRLVHPSRNLHGRAKATRDGAQKNSAVTKRLHDQLRSKS